MLQRPARARLAAFAFVAVGGSLAAQSPARLVEDLGDPVQGEAAEAALLALGSDAIAPLQQLFDAFSDTTDRERARLRAALRVVDLLGATAGPLAASLSAAAQTGRRDLDVPLNDARASLCPYAIEQPWHEQFHKRVHEGDPAEKGARMASFARHAVRSMTAPTLDVAAAKALLATDANFAREVAAEALGASADTTAVDALRDRLLAREQLPQQHASLYHNGFVVPMPDRFVLRASDALLRLAPDDPRAAIGYACRAVVHPHRRTRLDALRGLARFGPEAAVAVPELVGLARGDDAALSLEALKILGMVGRAAGPHLATFDALATREGPVGKLATNLARSLRAMGETPPAAVAEAPAAARAAVAAAAAALTDDGDREALAAAETTLLQHPDLAWPPLLERLRVEYAQTPRRVLALLGRLVGARPPADRATLRYAIASLGSDNWHAPMSATYSGGSELTTLHALVYGACVVDATAPLDDLVAHLADKNAAVRLVAARTLAGRHAEVATAAANGRTAARDTLEAAVAAAPSTESEFELCPDNRHGMTLDVTAPLQAAAAAALVDCERALPTVAAWFAKASAHDDEAVVVAVVARWGAHADEADLDRLGRDPRAAVAAAARTAKAARTGK